LSHIFHCRTGFRRVDACRIISGIIFVIRNGLRWRDAPAEYGPPKTIYNRFIRWSRMGMFNKIFEALAAKRSDASLPYRARK
jgi:transposase